MKPHISEQFDAELSAASARLMEMGANVEQQLRDACKAFTGHDTVLAERVMQADAEINRLEVRLDDLCVHVIARRQPAASDLRSLIAIMKASTDLERIGDEAGRIAEMALGAAAFEYPLDQYMDIRQLQTWVSRMLADVLDAFARLDSDQARTIIRADQRVDDGYNALVRKSAAAMSAQADEVQHALNVIWTARALERIGDHAKNIAEYVIYLVDGMDVRHGVNAASPAAQMTRQSMAS